MKGNSQMKDKEVPNHWTYNCFGCSKVNNNGLRLRFFLSEDGCYTKCSIPDYLCGLDGVVHGGMVALLLDEISQWTMIARIGKMGLTREISVRYWKPVLTNTEIVVEAKIETQDEKDTVLRSTIHSKDNELLAEGKSRWSMANPSTLAKISKVDESTIKEFLARYPC
jgi:uncharacterized protein (TIGR00369 family)